ncbi:MAG: succinate dehydrogenase cytochrome b subunit [Cyanobacteria bacterium P01_A01_bin.105]
MASGSSPQSLPFALSPIGKKLLTGMTGLGLVLFVLGHLVGNLTLFFSTNAYNQLGQLIESLGPLTGAVELLLLGAVMFHAALGLQIFIDKVRARSDRYAAYQSKGQPTGQSGPASAAAPSYQSLSSRSMIWTGLVLAVFLVWHLATFKFGPHYLVPDTEIRDLSRLVVEKFSQPAYVGGYGAVMVLLGVHLRHGLWSALQSLGLLNQRLRPFVYGTGTVLAILIATGFLGLPVAIYFDWLG